MPKLKLALTTEVTTVTDVKLKPHVRQMIKTRCEEHAGLAVVAKDTKRRMKAIDAEITGLFKKEKQGKALLDGTKLDSHGMKLVIGKTKKFDQLGFMKKHDVTVEDFEEFTERIDNTPYLKFTHPGEKDEDE